mmetsp:Transcript_75432/g.119095  ORF Transcript_75432/g.119095 Transcript_75432/m.119095 type:complete len:89 (+) Transcript_75432:50-316(+)
MWSFQETPAMVYSVKFAEQCSIPRTDCSSTLRPNALKASFAAVPNQTGHTEGGGRLELASATLSELVLLAGGRTWPAKSNLRGVMSRR